MFTSQTPASHEEASASFVVSGEVVATSSCVVVDVSLSVLLVVLDPSLASLADVLVSAAVVVSDPCWVFCVCASLEHPPIARAATK